MSGASALVGVAALTFALNVAACDPSTHRPTFTPRPEAATTELELAVPAATQALASALEGDSVPIARIAPRDGFLETAWLDAATMKPATKRPVGPDIVRLRGWVDPSRHGFSRLTVEVIYRSSVDPSLPMRETESAVPYANPARARVRDVLGKLGGVPVDQPEIMVAHAPAKPPADSAAAAAAAAAPAPAPNPGLLPSPVSVDSGTLLRGKRDSITSAAPAAAPTQGQRAAPTPAVAAPRPVVTAPTPAGVPDTTRPARVAPAARPSAAYSVQVAAARTRAEAEPIAAALVANGFAASIVSSGGWQKVWVGSYPTFAAADAVRRQIRAAQGGAPFVVRR